MAIYLGDEIAELEEIESEVNDYEIFKAVEGQVYAIAVASSSEYDFYLSVEVSDPPPANDAFSNAEEALFSENILVPGSLWGATRETSEAFHGNDSTQSGSVWYRYTPAADGYLQYRVVPEREGYTNAFSPLVYLYQGSNLESLQEIVYGTEAGFRYSFVEAGVSYSIAVAANASDGGGLFELELIQPPLRSNDDFSAALDLGSELSVVQASSTFDSTLEPGEPQHIEDPYSPDGSVWFRWTAPISGRVKFRVVTTGTWGDVMAVYTGQDLGTLTQLGTDRGSSEIDLDLEAGTTCFIAVGTTSMRNFGGFNLEIVSTVPSANDRFTDAVDLSLGETEIQDDGHWTLEAGEALVGAEGSTWFRWTAQVDSGVSSRLSGAAIGHRQSVYVGDSLSSLVLIDEGAALGFVADAGQTYYISVSSFADTYPGDFSIHLESNPLPANDAFATPAILAGDFPQEGTSYVLGAGAEAGEPDHHGTAASHSLWWQWTAPATASFDIDASGSDVRPDLAVYTGVSLAGLTPIASGDGRLFLEAVAGQTYRIAVDTGFSSLGEVNLTIRDELPPTAINDDVANRIELAGNVVEVHGGNVGATAEERETDGHHSVWWSWRASSDDPFTIDTSGTDFPHDVRVYTDYGLWRFDPTYVNVNTIARPTVGTVYYIAISGAEEGRVGNVRFKLSQDSTAPKPVNDHFVDSLDLGSPSSLATSLELWGATLEVDEPRHNNKLAASLWYQWTAPVTGVFRFSFSQFVPGSSYSQSSLGVGVYMGTSLGNLTEVASGADQVILSTQVGETYSIAIGPEVSGYWGVEAGIIAGLSLSRVDDQAPSNDFFAARRQLRSELPISATGRFFGATDELGEPDHNGVAANRSVWWEWTAPVSVRVGAVVGSLGNVGVYTGDSISTLTSVAEGEGQAFFNAVEGEIYKIVTDATQAGADLFTLIISAPPNNDDFEDSALMVGDFASAHGSNFLGSNETGEPVHIGDSSQSGSSWWHWIATASGGVDVALKNFNSAYNIAVYIGDELSSLTTIGGSSRGVLRFIANIGQMYRFAVSGSSTTSQGNFDLELEVLGARPPNDDFADSIELVEGESVTVLSDNFGGTFEFGEPAHSYFTQLENSVWWHWTASESTSVRILAKDPSTGSRSDIHVYTGDTLESLVPVSDSGSSQGIYIDTFAGETYRIAVVPGYPGESEFELELEPVGIRGNDDFASRIDLGSADELKFVGSFLGASLEPDEPRAASNLVSIWWTWTPASDQVVHLSADFIGSYSTSIGVFEGTNIDDLIEIAFDDNSSPQLTFYASAGTSYHFLASQRERTIATFVEFELEAEPLVANDDFSDRTVLDGMGAGVVSTNNYGASAEVAEPAHMGVPADSSIWFEWAAEDAGFYSFSSSNPFNRVGVYQGASLNSLVNVGSGYGNFAQLTAQAGEVFQIVVDSDSVRQGSLNLSIRYAAAVAVNDHFQGAVPLVTGSKFWTSDIGATIEEMEPSHQGQPDLRSSLWWHWEASHAGPVVLDVLSSTVVSVFTGDSLETLVPVEGLAESSSRFRFLAIPGVSYAIAVSRRETSAPGSLSVILTDLVNDDFAGAIDLGASTTAAAIGGNLFLASAETGEPFHAGKFERNSLWYRWQSPSSEVFRASVTDNFTMSIYQGASVSTLSEVPILGGLGVFEAAAGGEYYFVVTAAERYDSDEFSFSLAPIGSITANDDFAESIDLGMSAVVSVSGTLNGATREVGEPLHADYYARNGSVWWSWTAPQDMEVEINTSDSAGRTILAVYTGAGLLELEEVASEDRRETVFFRAVTGQTYHVAVSGWFSDVTGEVVLTLDQSAEQTYEGWAASHFPPGSPDADRQADPDKDGIDNATEYAFAQDPMQPGSGKPIADIVTSGSGFRIHFDRPRSATDLDYSYEYSVDLRNWRPMTSISESYSIDGDIESVNAYWGGTLTFLDRVYVRVIARP